MKGLTIILSPKRPQSICSAVRNFPATVAFSNRRSRISVNMPFISTTLSVISESGCGDISLVINKSRYKPVEWRAGDVYKVRHAALVIYLTSRLLATGNSVSSKG